MKTVNVLRKHKNKDVASLSKTIRNDWKEQYRQVSRELILAYVCLCVFFNLTRKNNPCVRLLLFHECKNDRRDAISIQLWLSKFP